MMRHEGKLLLDIRYEGNGPLYYVYRASNKTYLGSIKAFKRDGIGKYRYRVSGEELEFKTVTSALKHFESEMTKHSYLNNHTEPQRTLF